MEQLKETKKEDELYYQGAFWFISDSVFDIIKGYFKLEGVKLVSDFDGNYLEKIDSQKSLTHKRLWRDEFSKKYPELSSEDYNYYPRGRVTIYKGKAFIHIHHLFNTPKLIDTIIKEYNLFKLDVEIEHNDETQGDHYGFKLE